MTRRSAPSWPSVRISRSGPGGGVRVPGGGRGQRLRRSGRVPRGTRRGRAAVRDGPQAPPRTWAYGPDAHTPVDAARALAWGGPDDPGDWHRVTRTFRDGHTETWHAAGARLGWADFQVRSDAAIRRHQVLVTYAFSFCWDTWFHDRPAVHEPAAPRPEAVRGERGHARCRPAGTVLAAGTARGARLAFPWIALQRRKP